MASFPQEKRSEFINTLLERLHAINRTKKCSGASKMSTSTKEYLNIPDVHGWLGRNESWDLPLKVTHCSAEARPGYSEIEAHEYNDQPHVLREKVKVLVGLIKSSENCLLYTGAGISTPSGIGDYATQVEKEGRPKLRSPLEAQPTYSHFALKELYDNGLVKYWGMFLIGVIYYCNISDLVQQNHDGLPQKAGFPQTALNEIHGAWFDPSNPVVMMSGSLRSDLFEDLLQWEERSDLTLALGTSMCGMNSDRVFATVARKAKTRGDVGGGVIVGLQRTQHDDLASLKIYATVDDVMRLVAEELGVAVSQEVPPRPVREEEGEHTHHHHTFRVPYSSSTGERCEQSSDSCLLDLREGAKVVLTDGPYKGDEGEVIGTNLEGHYRIVFNHKLNPKKTLRRPFERVLGSWWIKEAISGSVRQIPIVNL